MPGSAQDRNRPEGTPGRSLLDGCPEDRRREAFAQPDQTSARPAVPWVSRNDRCVRTQGGSRLQWELWPGRLPGDSLTDVRGRRHRVAKAPSRGIWALRFRKLPGSRYRRASGIFRSAQIVRSQAKKQPHCTKVLSIPVDNVLLDRLLTLSTLSKPYEHEPGWSTGEIQAKVHRFLPHSSTAVPHLPQFVAVA